MSEAGEFCLEVFEHEHDEIDKDSHDCNGNSRRSEEELKTFLMKLSSTTPVSPIIMKMRMKLSVRELVESYCNEGGNDGKSLCSLFRRSHRPKLQRIKSPDHELWYSCSLKVGKKYRFTAKLDNLHITGSPIETFVEEKEELQRTGESCEDKKQMPPKMSEYCGELLSNTLHKYLQSCEVSFLEVKSWSRELVIPNVQRRPGSDQKQHQSCGGKVVLDRPIGICVLGNSFVVSTFEGRVMMFERCSGKYLKDVLGKNGARFKKPADMVSLDDGGFVLRDARRMMVFDDGGEFKETVLEDSPCYGLAQDEKGRLVCLQETKCGTTLNFLNLKTRESVKKIELTDLITNKALSKCRFLCYANGKFYITDLGLGKVYILDTESKDMKDSMEVTEVRGLFNDPAGVVVDHLGNMIVADSRNHRLCLFNGDRIFQGIVQTFPPIRRPSSIAFESGELYVLCLHGNAGLIKFKPKL